MSNPLRQLEAQGQAVWLDFVERAFVARGDLKRLVDEDGVTGVTSNPSIFEKAIGQSAAYDEGLATFDAVHPHATPVERYESLALADIRAAADVLRPVYDRLGGADGYVSLEVSPFLAHDTDGTITEAKRLWAALDRPNAMIKVPGTPEGVLAIRALIEAGINVNVTLLFAIDAYAAVAEAHLAGLETRLARGERISHIASVASFFVSRIDSAIDGEIDRRLAAGDAESDALKALRGKVAIANAKLAYLHYQGVVASARWRTLSEAGARPQRLLWASTGTKDPAFPDTLYVDTLIGPDTVNTMPPKTLDAFRDHGTAAETLTGDVKGALKIMAEVERLGLDLSGVTDRLVADGVKQFADAATTLLDAIEAKQPA